MGNVSAKSAGKANSYDYRPNNQGDEEGGGKIVRRDKNNVGSGVAPTNYLHALPREVILHVASYLNFKSLSNFGRASKITRGIFKIISDRNLLISIRAGKPASHEVHILKAYCKALDQLIAYKSGTKKAARNEMTGPDIEDARLAHLAQEIEAIVEAAWHLDITDARHFPMITLSLMEIIDAVANSESQESLISALVVSDDYGIQACIHNFATVVECAHEHEMKVRNGEGMKVAPLTDAPHGRLRSGLLWPYINSSKRWEAFNNLVGVVVAYRKRGVDLGKGHTDDTLFEILQLLPVSLAHIQQEELRTEAFLAAQQREARPSNFLSSVRSVFKRPQRD